MLQRCEDCRKNTFEIAQHIVVPESQNAKALADEPPVTLCIVWIAGVLAAVAFDDETVRKGYEVDNIVLDRLLPPEFRGRELSAS